MALWHHYIAFFHLIVIFHHAIVLHYDFIFIAPIEASVRSFAFGGRMIYISLWNLFIQLAYFTMAFVNDFIESKDTHTTAYSSRLSQVKNYLFAAVTFPLALNVGAMYWLLYFIDRDLVASREVQEVVPDWLTHMSRTNTMLFVAVEMLCVPRKYPRHRWSLLGLLSVLFAYIAWTVVIREVTGHWVHPIFERFNWPQRVGFFGFNIFVPVTFYFVGDLLNDQLARRRNNSSGGSGVQRKRSQKGKTSRPDIIKASVERSTAV